MPSGILKKVAGCAILDLYLITNLAAKERV